MPSNKRHLWKKAKDKSEWITMPHKKRLAILRKRKKERRVCSTVVVRHLAKVEIAGSSPARRSKMKGWKSKAFVKLSRSDPRGNWGKLGA